MKLINKILVILALSMGQVFAEPLPNEATYKYVSQYEPNHRYGSFDKSGYISLSNKSISEFIINSKITDWLGFGIRTFKPYKKTNDYWIWRVPKTEYKGLYVIGVYRGVCDIKGEDRCGWAGMTGLIFEETEAQIKNKKLKVSKENNISNIDFLNKKRGVIDFTPEEF